MSDHVSSFYAASANPSPAPVALYGDVQTDFVVVGGGYTGLSAALHAAEAGFSVVLLEGERIGWGASGRNGGQMIPGLRWSAPDMVKHFGRDHALRLLSLANSAADKVRARIRKHAIMCDLTPGHFLAAARPSHLDDLARERDCLTELLGYDSMTLVSASEGEHYVASPRYHGGLYDTQGGHIHPLNYALGLAAAARAAGVRIFEGSRVSRIDRGNHVAAHTEHGSVHAQFGLLACDTAIGALDRKLGAMTMGVANYNIATVPLGPERARSLIPCNAAVADTKFVLNYFRLTPDHRLIFGGGEKYTPRPPRDIKAFVRGHVEQIFPQLQGVDIEYGWGGMVGVSLNRLPDLGHKDGWFHAHGWSGHGVLLTTLAGELIAEAMKGTAERFDLFATLPGHHFPGGPMLRTPLSIAGMLYYALRDRL